MECLICKDILIEIRQKSNYPTRFFHIKKMKVIDNSICCDKCVKNYIIISHTWNNKNDIKSGKEFGVEWNIQIDVKDKLLNCINFINENMEYNNTKLIWIDSLCINQNDENDKINEIPKMKIYYSNAIICLALLPDINNIHLKNLTNLYVKKNKYYELKLQFEKINHNLRPKFWIDFIKDEEKINELKEISLYLDKILCSKWFKRIWTIQEYLIPNEIVFITLNINMSKDKNIYSCKKTDLINFVDIIQPFLFEIGLTLGLDKEGTGLYVLLMVDEIKKYKKYKKLSFNTACSLLKDRNCYLEEDKIYGLLGLLDIDSNNLKIEYGIGLDKALLIVCNNLLINKKDIEMLFYVTINNNNSYIPSSKNIDRAYVYINAIIKKNNVFNMSILDNKLNIKQAHILKIKKDFEIYHITGIDSTLNMNATLLYSGRGNIKNYEMLMNSIMPYRYHETFKKELVNEMMNKWKEFKGDKNNMKNYVPSILTNNYNNANIYNAYRTCCALIRDPLSTIHASIWTVSETNRHILCFIEENYTINTEAYIMDIGYTGWGGLPISIVIMLDSNQNSYYRVGSSFSIIDFDDLKNNDRKIYDIMDIALLSKFNKKN